MMAPLSYGLIDDSSQREDINKYCVRIVLLVEFDRESYVGSGGIYSGVSFIV